MSPVTAQALLDGIYPAPEHTMPEAIEVSGNPPIYLRHITYADALALTEVAERNYDDFAKYLGWAGQVTLAKMLERVERLLHLSNSDEGMAYCIMQGTREEPGELIGSTRLFDRYPDWRMSGSFDLKGPVMHCGSWLDKEARGQGIMRRARLALFEYAQKRWGIENIFMDIALDNTAAERSARAIGAVPMNMSYWQMKRPFEYADPDIFGGFANSSEDARQMLEQAARYNRKMAANTIIMQRWLLRLAEVDYP